MRPLQRVVEPLSPPFVKEKCASVTAVYTVSWKVGPDLSAVTGRISVTPSGLVFLRLRERNRA